MILFTAACFLRFTSVMLVHFAREMYNTNIHFKGVEMIKSAAHFNTAHGDNHGILHYILWFSAFTTFSPNANVKKKFDEKKTKINSMKNL